MARYSGRNVYFCLGPYVANISLRRALSTCVPSRQGLRWPMRPDIEALHHDAGTTMPGDGMPMRVIVAQLSDVTAFKARVYARGVRGAVGRRRIGGATPGRGAALRGPES